MTMKKLVVALVLAGTVASSIADIQAPPRPGPVRKLGAGLAKTAFSGAFVLDSMYDKVTYEGGTSAFTIGIIDGTSKAIFSTGLGIAEMGTFAVPPYRPFNARYDLPPSDLKNFY